MNENNILELDKGRITEKIYTIRGVQVMLDGDLAELYGYETKNFNRQVKNNIAKFEGEDFMFQLNDLEIEELSRCKNFTLNKITGRGSNIKYKPYAFTEQGIYMIMTVLKGELATKQSRALVKTFKEMRHYLMENQHLLTNNDYLRLSLQVNENTNAISKMITKDYFEEVMKEFIGPNRKEEYLFLDGEKFSANVAYNQIYKTAKQSIYIVDNYIGLKTLLHLKDIDHSVNVILFSDNIRNGLTLTEYNDFFNQYHINISFKITNNKYHDRYIVLDYNTSNEVIYHCGASSKDAGNKITSITKISDISNYKNMINELLLNNNLVLK